MAVASRGEALSVFQKLIYDDPVEARTSWPTLSAQTAWSRRAIRSGWTLQR